MFGADRQQALRRAADARFVIEDFVPAYRSLDARQLDSRVDAALAEARPVCAMSGRCCDFPTSGHELWATDLETALARQRAGGPVPEAPSGLCPWHVEGTCRLRDGRPLGCRLYFCDPSWEESMPAAYERFGEEEVSRLHRISGGVPRPLHALANDLLSGREDAAAGQESDDDRISLLEAIAPCRRSDED